MHCIREEITRFRHIYLCSNYSSQQNSSENHFQGSMGSKQFCIYCRLNQFTFKMHGAS